MLKNVIGEKFVSERGKRRKRKGRAIVGGGVRLRTMLTLALMLLLMSTTALAAIPQIVTYQGKLVSSEGTPLTGSYNMTFKIYSLSSGGSELWTEGPTSVPVDHGRFNVVLGESTPIGTDVFTGADRWLGITVGGDSEMTPRMKMTAVGYAFKAYNADKLGGLSSTELGGGGISTAEADTKYVNVTGDTMTGNLVITSEASRLKVVGSMETGDPSSSASGLYAVAMGYQTTASGPYSVALGGYTKALGERSVAMGAGNTASGFAAMALGAGTKATNTNSTAMGFWAIASGTNSLAAGYYTSAEANYSAALGQQSQAGHQGTFVWADSTDAVFRSTAQDQFLIRASGGVGIGTATTNSQLTVNGTIETNGTGGIKFPDGTIQTTKAVAGGGISTAEADTKYVNIDGDTMTGILTLAANGLIAGTDQLVLSGGKVGIGSATPANKLYVKDNSSSPNAALYVSQEGTGYSGYFRGGNNDTPVIYGYSPYASASYPLYFKGGTKTFALYMHPSYGVYLGTTSNDRLSFYASDGWEALTVGTDGNVMIGAGSNHYDAVVPLEVYASSGAQLRLSQDVASGYSDLQTDSNGDLQIYPSRRVQINNNLLVIGKTYYRSDLTHFSGYNAGGYFESIHPNAILISNSDSTFDVGLGFDYTASPSFAEIWHAKTGGGYSSIKVKDGLIDINPNALDTDTQIQGDTDAYLLYADASTDRVGIGLNNPGQKLSVAGVVESTTGGFMLPDDTIIDGAEDLGGGGGISTAEADTRYVNVTGDKMTGKLTIEVSSGGAAEIGYQSSARGNKSIALGDGTIAEGASTVAIGADSYTSNNYAVAVGYAATASGVKSMALGSTIQVDGMNSIGIGLEDYWYDVTQDHTMAIMGGRVGIATVAPTATFEVDGTAAITRRLMVGTTESAAGTGMTVDTWNNSDWNTLWINSAAPGVQMGTWVDSNGGWFGTVSDNKLYLAANSSAVGSGKMLTILGDGNVGIGTETPQRKLTVDGTIETSGNGGIMFQDGTTQITAATGGGGISTSEADTRYVNIDGDTMTGNLHINTSLEVGDSNTHANGAYSIAVGQSTIATGVDSFAAGLSSLAVGDYSVAAGYGNHANGVRSVALGDSNVAGEYAIAMGSANTASGTVSTAIGWNCLATGEGSVALGTNSQAHNVRAFAGGDTAKANGNSSVAIGAAVVANGTAATAIGWGTTTNNSGSVAIGYYSTANGQYSVALGNTNIADGHSSTALGAGSYTNGTGSMATGWGVNAIGEASFAAGRNTLASGNRAFAMGYATIASGEESTAMGLYTNAEGYAATAMGISSQAKSYSSFALGRRAVAQNNGSFVYADNADADFASTGENQFIIRTTGGVGISTTDALNANGIAAQGMIESRSGGFKFPNGSIQTEAAAGGGGISTSEADSRYVNLDGDTMVGALALGDYNLTFRDTNHGVGYYGSGKLWNSTLIDGPVIFGYGGGALGTTGNNNTVLRWRDNADGGRVIIGSTADPVNKLDVEGAAAIGATYSGTNTAPTNGLIVEGNVGIGNSSTNSAKLYVNGSAEVNGNLKVTGTIEGASPVKISGGLIITGGITIDGSIKSTDGTNGLTVDGTIETTVGGIKFPDDTIQIFAYPGTEQKGVSFLYPYATNEAHIRLPFNATITSLEVYCYGGTSVNGKVEIGGNSANATANAGAYASGSVAAIASYTAYDDIKITTPAVSGAVNSASILINYKRTN